MRHQKDAEHTGTSYVSLGELLVLKTELLPGQLSMLHDNRHGFLKPSKSLIDQELLLRVFKLGQGQNFDSLLLYWLARIP